MLDAIIKNNPILNNFMAAFRPAFRNRRQFRHFQHYLIAIMLYLGRKNLSGLSRAIPDETDQSSLYRFLAKQDWDAEVVEGQRLAQVNRRVRRAIQAQKKQGEVLPVYLIIDDSLVEKTGKKMEGVAKHRSHKHENKRVLGHVWVTGQLVVLGQSYPFAWELYRRQAECEAAGAAFFSKPTLALRIVQAFVPLLDTQTYVLTDSWYASQELLECCTTRQFHFVGSVKANRKFSTAGHHLQVQTWSRSIPASAFERVKVKGHWFKGWRSTGKLASGHAVQLLINRRIGHKQWHYLISTDLTLSTATLLTYALTRWEVENFYRVMKQQCGWGDYQMRNLVAIQRHVLLIMLTYTYLEFQRQDALAHIEAEPLALTLGDVQRQLQQQANRATIALVFHLALRGDSLEMIYETLAA